MRATQQNVQPSEKVGIEEVNPHDEEVNNEDNNDHPQTEHAKKENTANQQQTKVFKIEYNAYHKPSETSKNEDLSDHKENKELKIGEDSQSDDLKSELKGTVMKGYLRYKQEGYKADMGDELQLKQEIYRREQTDHLSPPIQEKETTERGRKLQALLEAYRKDTCKKN